jgi:hypothetical protein
MNIREEFETRWGSCRVVGADIIRAVGKGFLIASVGVMVGMLLGTADPAVARCLALIGTGTVGAVCLAAAGILRQSDADERIRGVQSPEQNATRTVGRSPALTCDHERSAPDDAPECRFAERIAGDRKRRTRVGPAL